jgi:phage recombination protein Bet
MEFTEQELKSIRAEFCRGFTDDQFGVFLTFCRVRNLLPGKHVVAQIRKSNEWDSDAGAKIKTEKVIFITTIDAARLIAQRTGEYKGQAPEQYIYLDSEGMPTLISEIPLPDPGNRQLPREPWAVRTSLYRKGFDHPITSVARFDAYAVTRRSGEGLVLTEMWQRRGPEMLAKCCEMLSLRKGFPEELSNLYLLDEMKTEPEDDKPHAEPTSVINVPAPPVVPAVNQTPATPTNTPRPSDEPTVTVTLATTAPPTLDMVRRVEAEVPAVTPEPVEKKEEKPARKPRAKKESPVNGPEAITNEDVEAAMIPIPAADLEREAEIRKNAAAAVEEATSFTVEEAVAQGLPAPEDPIPSKEEMKEITQWIRKIAATGIGNQELKEYFLRSAGKTDPKFITKKEWAKAFEEFHKAELEGRGKEFVKGIDPSPKP